MRNQIVRIGVLLEIDQTTQEAPFSAKDLILRLSDLTDLTVIQAPCWTDSNALDSIRSVCLEQAFDRVVICGPSPESSQLEDWISLDDERAVPLVYAAIRNHLSPSNTRQEDAEVAERLIRMAIARVGQISPVQLIDKEVERRVLLVGGGHAALLAAQVIAEQGLQVTVTETEASSSCVYPLPADLVEEVYRNERIEYLKGTHLDYLDGGVGAFKVDLNTPDGRRQIKVGSIVVAVDAQAMPLELSSELVASGRVIDLRALGEELVCGQGRQDSICILLDADSDQRRCAAQAAVRFALQQTQAGGQAVVVAQQMPVYGTDGQEIYDQARMSGVRFLRISESPHIEVSENCLTIRIEDCVLPNQEVTLDVDRLVLPSKMRPSARIVELAHILRQPRDLIGYLQSGNVRHRPVGSARRGVYFIGGCHDECDPSQARQEAQAVLAGILADLPDKRVRVPENRVFYDTGHCSRCLNCMRCCPHGAIGPNEAGHWMELIDTACWQCGICASVCPGLALEHGALRFEQVHDLLKVAVDELCGSVPLIVFACRQGAIRALDTARREGLRIPNDLLFVDVPCAGLISDRILLDTIEQGARGAVILGCHHDNCRSLWGSDLARARVDRIHEQLAALGLPGERVRFQSIAANEAFRLVRLLKEATEQMPGGRCCALEPKVTKPRVEQTKQEEICHG